MRCVIALVISAFSFQACVAKDEVDSRGSAECTQLRILKLDRAVADANLEASKGHYELLGVRGYTIEYPGVTIDRSKLGPNWSERILTGTSDAYRSVECQSLNEAATEYAKRYNAEMLRIAGIQK